MKADIKTKWVAALRSGKYSQGRARLRDGDQYCCLGVLAEVEGVPAVDMTGFGSYVYKFDDASNTLNISDGFSALVGLSYEAACALSMMNDGGPNGIGAKSFDEIADFIESELN